MLQFAYKSGPLFSELPTDELPFAELVCEFIERAREKAVELRLAQRGNQIEQLAKLAHWMKGSGGMAGFPMLTQCARELEIAIHHFDASAIDASLSDLETLVSGLQSPSLSAIDAA